MVLNQRGTAKVIFMVPSIHILPSLFQLDAAQTSRSNPTQMLDPEVPRPLEPLSAPSAPSNIHCGVSLRVDGMLNASMTGRFANRFRTFDALERTRSNQMGMGLSCVRRTGVSLMAGVELNYVQTRIESQPHIYSNGSFTHYSDLLHGFGIGAHASLGFPLLDAVDVFTRIAGDTGLTLQDKEIYGYLQFQASLGARAFISQDPDFRFSLEVEGGYLRRAYLNSETLHDLNGFFVGFRGAVYFWNF